MAVCKVITKRNFQSYAVSLCPHSQVCVCSVLRIRCMHLSMFVDAKEKK